MKDYVARVIDGKVELTVHPPQKWVKINIARVNAETDKAVLCKLKGMPEFWIPLSQIKGDPYEGEVEIPEWLAAEKGII